jgi:hypothetical protein
MNKPKTIRLFGKVLKAIVPPTAVAGWLWSSKNKAAWLRVVCDKNSQDYYSVEVRLTGAVIGSGVSRNQEMARNLALEHAKVWAWNSTQVLRGIPSL